MMLKWPNSVYYHEMVFVQMGTDTGGFGFGNCVLAVVWGKHSVET